MPIVPFLLVLCIHPRLLLSFFFFFFNDTATTEIYTLSLHDALPISERARVQRRKQAGGDEHGTGGRRGGLSGRLVRGEADGASRAACSRGGSIARLAADAADADRHPAVAKSRGICRRSRRRQRDSPVRTVHGRALGAGGAGAARSGHRAVAIDPCAC